jgi:hypothetical protein
MKAALTLLILLMACFTFAQSRELVYKNEGIQARIVRFEQRYLNDSIAYTVEVKIKNIGPDSLQFPLEVFKPDSTYKGTERQFVFESFDTDIHLETQLFYNAYGKVRGNWPAPHSDLGLRKRLEVPFFHGDSLILIVHSGIKPRKKSRAFIQFYFEKFSEKEIMRNDETLSWIPRIYLFLDIFPVRFSNKANTWMLQPCWYEVRDKDKSGNL